MQGTTVNRPRVVVILFGRCTLTRQLIRLCHAVAKDERRRLLANTVDDHNDKVNDTEGDAFPFYGFVCTGRRRRDREPEARDRHWTPSPPIELVHEDDRARTDDAPVSLLYGSRLFGETRRAWRHSTLATDVFRTTENQRTLIVADETIAFWPRRFRRRIDELYIADIDLLRRFANELPFSAYPLSSVNRHCIDARYGNFLRLTPPPSIRLPAQTGSTSTSSSSPDMCRLRKSTESRSWQINTYDL